MSFLQGLFGSKKKDKAISTSEAIQKLRDSEEMLHKKEEFLEMKIEQELDNARKFHTTNKRAAILALKRKKRYEKQLQQIDGTLSTIEMQREALESANTNTSILKTMKDASEALKHAHEHMNVDEVHEMMDDIAEQQDVAKEISEAISNPVPFSDDVDEDDLMRELEELEQQDLDRKLLEPNLPKLPDVPEPVAPSSAATKKQAEKATSGSSGRSRNEDDELKELEQWAT